MLPKISVQMHQIWFISVKHDTADYLSSLQHQNQNLNPPKHTQLTHFHRKTRISIKSSHLRSWNERKIRKNWLKWFIGYQYIHRIFLLQTKDYISLVSANLRKISRLKNHPTLNLSPQSLNDPQHWYLVYYV